MTFDESLEAVRVFRTRVALGGVVHPETYRQWLSDLEKALDDARSEYGLLESQNRALQEERDEAVFALAALGDRFTALRERVERAEAAEFMPEDYRVLQRRWQRENGEQLRQAESQNRALREALEQAEQNIAMRQQHHNEEDLPEIKALRERTEKAEAGCVYVAALADHWAQRCTDEGDDRTAGAWLDARDGARAAFSSTEMEMDGGSELVTRHDLTCSYDDCIAPSGSEGHQLASWVGSSE